MQHGVGGHASWGTDIMEKSLLQNPARRTASPRPRPLPSPGAARKAGQTAQGVGGADCAHCTLAGPPSGLVPCLGWARAYIL